MTLESASDGTICNEHDSLVDHDTWVIILEPILRDSATVEVLARLLFTLKKAIDSGPEGVRRASDTLTAGIELAYLHTDAHKVAFRLYVLSLSGRLKPQDEPLKIINQAIMNTMAEVALEGKGRASKKKR
ncbi:MAG TPA: hypothetical protein VEQ42_12520 [Pyrinomonadaceae bacterium]|nr:hypothetical protein [Pyrinomonadaceae bacterium]